MHVLAKGPSPTARNLFVLSVKETSAMGFLANLFFTDAEIEEIMAAPQDIPSEDTDASMIVIPRPSGPAQENPDEPVTDAWGLVDEDGDGIILERVNGEGYNGYMMIVLDPSRVVMASKVEDFGIRGYTVEEMVAEYDAVAGINAGGFYDPNGRGNGSIPDTLVVSGGKVYYPENGIREGFAGFDANHILHVGTMSVSEIKSKGIQSGVCFGPVLISNGVPREQSFSGVNPRTAIGQRSDGAILMLVIEGRQVTSMGATYQDLTEIFLSYGAVNACNLDGGSSTMMWYQGGYVNKCASVIGIRPLPTTFLVLKEGGAKE
jgi:exopolysaccharide biosynthesis protein